MDKKLVEAINAQINHELYSSYLYLSMAAYCESKNLGGFAHWMKVQAKEENAHAMKFFEFLSDRGERIVFEAIAKPPVDFSSAEDVFKKTLAHEKQITALIDKLYELSGKVKDNAATVLLHWFINEQVEEEKNAVKILEDIKVVKDSAALIMLDRELGRRE